MDIIHQKNAEIMTEKYEKSKKYFTHGKSNILSTIKGPFTPALRLFYPCKSKFTSEY